MEEEEAKRKGRERERGRHVARVCRIFLSQLAVPLATLRASFPPSVPQATFFGTAFQTSASLAKERKRKRDKEREGEKEKEGAHGRTTSTSNSRRQRETRMESSLFRG